jgi:hypothetical protein
MKWNIIVGSLVLGLGLSTQSFGLDLLDRMLGVNYNGCASKATCCETPCADPAPSCGCDAPCAVSCDPCAVRCRKTPILDLLRSRKCRKASCCDNGCADPVCGCEAVVDPGCGVDPACGAEPSCCAPACKPKRCRQPLLDRLRTRLCKPSCCDNGCADPVCGCEAVVDPGCGCEPACGADVVCKPKRCRVSLLDRIFNRRCKVACCANGCADPGCGCEPSCGFEPTRMNGNGPTEAHDEVGPAPVVDPSAFQPNKRRFIQTNFVR